MLNIHFYFCCFSVSWHASVLVLKTEQAYLFHSVSALLNVLYVCSLAPLVYPHMESCFFHLLSEISSPTHILKNKETKWEEKTCKATAF